MIDNASLDLSKGRDKKIGIEISIKIWNIARSVLAPKICLVSSSLLIKLKHRYNYLLLVIWSGRGDEMQDKISIKIWNIATDILVSAISPVPNILLIKLKHVLKKIEGVPFISGIEKRR